MAIGLTAEQLAAYRRDGYIVIEDVISAQEVEALRARLRDYTHGGRPWGNLRVQIEPRIQRGETSTSQVGDGIRKIELLVEEDDLFRRLGLHENMVGVIEHILGPDLKMYRNALLFKPPEVGSQKGWHQDSPYWPIEPMALCSCWLPLDDATPENGCMQALRGEHTRGPLPHVAVTDDYVIAPGSYDPSRAVALPMRAGSGLFFHSLLPHYTGPNLSSKWRRAAVLSYMSAHSRYSGEGESPVFFHVKGQTFPGCVR
jgi:phytanoyl-CoA hydroxylase